MYSKFFIFEHNIYLKRIVMIELGKVNRLVIKRIVDFGVYLSGTDEMEILLPTRYLPEKYELGDDISVFVYKDSEDRWIATTEMPYAQVGDFAYLEVKSVSRYGAFMDWGLMKDLFVPFKEQKVRMEEGRFYVVYIYVDEDTERIVASAKIDRYVSKISSPYKYGDKVELLIYQYSNLGYKAVVDNCYMGLLYEDEVFRPLAVGDRVSAYIKQIREDAKIDLILDKPGYEKVSDVSKTIFEYLENEGGFIPLTDKSPANDIYNTFGVSKKTFKKAIGDLYKHRLISIEDRGIVLNKTE